MLNYTLSEAKNKQGEVFAQATVEPILITENLSPSYVIMSAKNYEALIARLTELEDLTLAYEAQLALANSQMVGVAEFTQAISVIAHDKA